MLKVQACWKVRTMKPKQAHSRNQPAFIQLSAQWIYGPQLIVRIGTSESRWYRVFKSQDGSRCFRIGPFEIGIWY